MCIRLVWGWGRVRQIHVKKFRLAAENPLTGQECVEALERQECMPRAADASEDDESDGKESRFGDPNDEAHQATNPSPNKRQHHTVTPMKAGPSEACDSDDEAVALNEDVVGSRVDLIDLNKILNGSPPLRQRRRRLSERVRGLAQDGATDAEIAEKNGYQARLSLAADAEALSDPGCILSMPQKQFSG